MGGAPKKGRRRLEQSMIDLRKEGYIVARTERWNPFAKVRQDLFGFADAIYLGDEEITALQCVNSGLKEHIDKILKNEAAQLWLLSGGKIVIHNWKQRSKNKVKSWHCEVIQVTP